MPMPRPLLAAPCVLALALLGACNSPWGYVGGAAGAAVLGGQAPANELHQVYYLGVFDPQEQLPQAVYRITVRGQGSFISQTKFASGWVPAAVVDTLNENITFDDKMGLKVEGADKTDAAFLKGRRLMLFGPEGFREAPANHRLVIVMGSNPSAFFDAVGKQLEQIAQMRREPVSGQAAQQLGLELSRLREEEDRLLALQARFPAPAAQGAQP
jgi:hypothetical protein